VVGGIGANRARPADFFIDNALMGASILNACRNYRVEKLVMIGTTCGYPKFAEVPFVETAIWDGYPEETNAPYGVIKRALMVGAEALISQYGVKVANLIPTNMYGPGDNFDLDSSHVIPAIMRKMIDANGDVELWGTGSPTRDFLYVKDAAKAIVNAGELAENGKPINLGSGVEVSIKEIAAAIASVVGFKGKIKWNTSQPDGQPRRALCTFRADQYLNWEASTPLTAGLQETYQDFIASRSYMR
jgi:GDP-L-fucose synthase